MSIDSSTSSTGISIFVDSNYKKSVLLETDKKLKGDEKLESMILLIYDLIKKERPDIVVTELTAVVRNPKVQRMLTELLGSIRGKCVENKIAYNSLRPTEWRSVITKITNQKSKGRKREDQKAWSLDVVNNIYGINTESNDISDSYLIGVSFIENMK